MRDTIEQNNQSSKLQVFAFCVVNVNSTIVLEHFGNLKNLIILNIFKEKLVNSCLLGSFYLNPIQDGGRGGKKAIPSASPKLLNLNQEHPTKKIGFSGQILIKLRLW